MLTQRRQHLGQAAVLAGWAAHPGGVFHDMRVVPRGAGGEPNRRGGGDAQRDAAAAAGSRGGGGAGQPAGRHAGTARRQVARAGQAARGGRGAAAATAGGCRSGGRSGRPGRPVGRLRMLTYRTGAAGAPSAARAMADHLLEQTLPQAQAELAEYYQRGLAPAEPGMTVAEPRRDMDPRVARLLGVDPNRASSVEAIAQLLAGNRADGEKIPGKQVQRASESLAALLGLEPSTTLPGAAE